MAPVDGAAPVHPPMDGLHLDGMHVLQTTGDTFALQHVLAAGGARSALVVERHLRLLDEWKASSGCWLVRSAAAGQLHEQELTAGGGGRCRLGVDRFTPRRAAWYSCSCAAGDPGTIPGRGRAGPPG
jgi:hypothetical protein